MIFTKRKNSTIFHHSKFRKHWVLWIVAVSIPFLESKRLSVKLTSEISFVKMFRLNFDGISNRTVVNSFCIVNIKAIHECLNKMKDNQKIDMVRFQIRWWWGGPTLSCSSLFQIGRAATFNFSNDSSRFKCSADVESILMLAAGKWKLQKQKLKTFLPPSAVLSTSELNELTVLNRVNWCKPLEIVFRIAARTHALNTALCLIYQNEENF